MNQLVTAAIMASYPPTQPRAQADDYEGHIKLPYTLNKGEKHKSQAHYTEAHYHHAARAKTIDESALDGTQGGALHPGEGEGPR